MTRHDYLEGLAGRVVVLIVIFAVMAYLRWKKLRDSL